MTTNEIKFLLENGLTISEIMTLSTTPEAVTQEEPKTTPEAVTQEESKTTPEETGQDTQTEPVQDEVIKKLTDSLTALQAEVTKLSGRIAAQGIKASTHESAEQDIDDILANIGKKLNGGDK